MISVKKYYSTANSKNNGKNKTIETENSVADSLASISDAKDVKIVLL